MKWFVKCIKHYVDFAGRARRKEYWYFVLFYFIFIILAVIADALIFGKPLGTCYSLMCLFLLLPSISVQVRRLHDTDRSGQWVMWYLIAYFVWAALMLLSGLTFMVQAIAGQIGTPSLFFMIIAVGGFLAIMAGSVLMIVWSCFRGTRGANQYGPDPLAVEE